METLPLDFAVTDTPALASPSIQPEVSPSAPKPAAPEEGASEVAGKDSGCKGLSPNESRPRVLDGLEPIEPAEQRKLLPKKKAKAKAAPKEKKEKMDKKEKTTKDTKKHKKSGDGKPKGKEEGKCKGKDGVEGDKNKPKRGPPKKRERENDPSVGEGSGSANASGSRDFPQPSGDEAKKRVSRKSSAYHCAKRQALKDGKTLDEAKALAKKVSWQ